jgi:hypothetical protein
MGLSCRLPDLAPRRWAGLAFVAAIVALAALIGPPASADAAMSNFCGPGYLGADGYCNRGYYVPLAAMEASADHNSYAIYRATDSYPGAPSASGQEYFSTSGGYIYQDFHCYGGYPASHNRHSFTIYVYYTNSDNCV